MRRVWLTVLVVLCSGIGATEEAVGENNQTQSSMVTTESL